MAVPNIFGSATAAIPLSQLDQNFATAITLGNTAVYLGNTTTSLGNVTLTNVTISSGTSNIAANVSIAVGLLPEANGGTGTTTGYYGFKNRLINSAMVIDQRNAGASVTPTTNQYSLDRWEFFVTQSSKVSFQQNAGSVTPPVGFKNYLGLTVGASASVTVGSTDLFILNQFIEGYNIADLGFGAAGSSTVTLSFWVRSSLTGTFGGSLTNSGNSRSYPFTYTISLANTWEQKTITVAGDTSGTWLSTNGTGLGVRFSIGTGSTYLGTSGSWAGTGYFGATGQTNLITTNSATFYITGVQLEKGSTATSFDYRPYGTELALCQRYLPAMSFSSGSNPYFGAGMASSATTAYFTISFPVTPRVPPTGLIVSSASHFGAFLPSTATTNCTSFGFGGANSHSAFVVLAGMAGLTAGNSTLIYMNNSSALLYFTGSEL